MMFVGFKMDEFKIIQKKYAKILLKELDQWSLWLDPLYDDVCLINYRYGYLIAPWGVEEIVDAENSLRELGYFFVGDL